MRPDVKLGIVVSTVFVMVAGTYFLVQDRQDGAIPVSSDPAALVSNSGKTSAVPSKTQPKKRSTAPASAGSKRRAERQAPRKTFGGKSTGQRTANATPKRDPNAQQRKPSRAKGGTPQTVPAGAKRSVNPALAQRNRSRNGQQPRRRQPVAKKPKPQIALTATPANDANKAIERHRVQQGDTMTSLAKQYYGSTQFAQFLISQNKQIADPARLRAGDIVNIVPRPAEGKSRKKSMTAAPSKKPTLSSREYRIKSGDSFYRIAKNVLGDAKRWNELYEMNKKIVGDDPTKLQVGQVIMLPKK